MVDVSSLEAPDARDLFLTIHGVKPASSAYALVPAEAEPHRSLIEALEAVGIPYHHEVLNGQRELLGTDGVWRASDDRTHILTVGRDASALEAAVNARTSHELGRAYGYPELSIRDLDALDAAPYLQAISQMREAGRVPSFLAYVPFVPSDLDGQNGYVPKHVREVGVRYQSFVRERDEHLAASIEEWFSTRPLPNSFADDELGWDAPLDAA